MTLEAWAALPEDEPGELVDGRLEEEEVGDATHESVVAWLIGEFRAWLKGKGGFILASDAKFAVSKTRGRKPDVTVYLPGGTVPTRRGLLRFPPDIAVEVVSPMPSDQRRDRIVKLAEYTVFGVRWYWLLDPAMRSLEVLELRDGVYAHVLGATDGVVGSVPGCPDLALDLSDLWAELDRLGPEEPEPQNP
jgi:Uma2 family endonuclease